MIEVSKAKYLPHLETYLTERVSKDPQNYWTGVGVLGTIGAGLGVFQLYQGSYPFINSLAILGLGLGAWFGGAALFSYMRRKKRPDSVAAETYVAVRTLKEATDNRALKKQLDPVIAPIAEYIFQIWFQIHQKLEGPAWQGQLSASNVALRAEVLAAVDFAADEAIRLTAQCFGPPQRTEKDAWKDMMHSVSNMDFGEALSDLSDLISRDPQKYSHQSVNRSSVFPVLREIAEKMKLLRADVERLSSPASTIYREGSLSQASGEIDSVLRVMEATRVAEAELEDSDSATIRTDF